MVRSLSLALISLSLALPSLVHAQYTVPSDEVEVAPSHRGLVNVATPARPPLRLVGAAQPNPAQPNATPADPSRPGAFQFSLGLGMSLGWTNVGEDTTNPHEDDSADAIGFAGTLTLAALTSHHRYESGLEFSTTLGYRGSFDRFLIGVVDTGLIHRHEASLSFVLRRRLTAAIGGGISFLVDEGESFRGGAIHIDLRYGFRSGMFVGVPTSVTWFKGPSDTVIITSVGLELGWQSLR